MRALAVVCSLIVGTAFFPLPALAQQKTVKSCQEEWRANKAANQAKGITEKTYVAQCRAGTAKEAPPPAAPPAATQAKPKPKPSAPPAQSRPAATAAPAAATPTAANQYSTEAQAKGRCGADLVVWVNLGSKIYHFAGHKSYGHTKAGAYMCERQAISEGMRAAKNEKHP